MEAAQLRCAIPASPSCRALIVEKVVVDDPTAAEFVRAGSEAGDDPVRVVADAIEIGARVLDREQAGANVEIVRRTSRRRARGGRAAARRDVRGGTPSCRKQLDEAFGPESGHVARVLTKPLRRRVAEAVQHQLRDRGRRG